VALGPAEVHPEEHLGPVGRLGPAGAGADREDRSASVVLAREEEGGALAAEVALELGRRSVELGRQLGIAGFLDELEGRQEVVDAGLETTPELDLRAQVVRFAEDLLGAALVVPEPGLAGQRLQLGDTPLLRLEVKDAPRSTGSARPGREPWRRPLVPRLEVLQQDRAELDQAKGRLAPGDDGVHAGTVRVVRADAAVAVTVESRGVTAVPAVTLAGDEIDERRFLGLLQLVPLSVRQGWRAGRATARGSSSIPGPREFPGV
jgi:hypothetical protein